ncbi:MAG: PAS domain S-box protein [Armatimonadota bacterium]
MSILIQVLIVEDSENDALLVVEELRSGGIEPVWERVETAQTMNEALAHKAWDIIIADYAMPHFSGIGALELAKQKDPDLPLILISGQLREEEAVEAMRSGARDFISKNNMSRLAPAVEREVRESQIRRERRAAQELFVKAFNSTPEIMFINVLENDCFLDVNTAFVCLLGYTRKETIGRTSIELNIWADISQRDEMARTLTANQTVRNWEVLIKTKSGRILTTLFSAELVEFNGQECVLTVAADITDRKKAEEALLKSEENFRAMFDYTPAAVFSYNRQGIILQANSACEELFDIPRDMMIGKGLFETVGRSKNRQELMKRIEYVFTGGSVKNIEWLDTPPNGVQRWILTNVTPVCDPGGRVVMGLSLNMDITERKEIENRKLEQDAHKLEFYRRTILAATDGKLVITERLEIERIAKLTLASWRINSPDDLATIRHVAAEIAESEGMDENKIGDFILAFGEASTNALKHAGSGTASIHRQQDRLMFVVSDNGPGIAVLSLPEVALRRGYSTAGTLGMGYKVMIQLADKVYLATGAEGTTIGIEMSLHHSMEIPLVTVSNFITGKI